MQLPKGAVMTFEQWQRQACQMSEAANRIAKMRTERARRIGREAGIGDDAPFHMAHNAMCGLHAGRPWVGVDYSKVRQLDRWNREGYVFEGYRIVKRWHSRVGVV